MENKTIIIILIAIIIVLAAILGVMFLQSSNAKEPSKIKIISNKTLYEGDSLSIQLTDLNKTPISKEKVNITIKDKKGKIIVNKTVKTNSKGKAKLELDLKKGNYSVNVTYGGNENYSANSTTKNIKIVETISEEVAPAPQTTEIDSSQDTVQSDNFESEDYDYEMDINGPEDLPYPIRAEDDRNGMRM